jgi:hypothetical protein
LDRPSAVGLDVVARAILGLARTQHRTMIYERLTSIAAGGPAIRAAATIILRRMSTMTEDNGPRTSIRLAEEKIKLSDVEERAVAEWLKIYMGAADGKKRRVPKGTDVAAELGTLSERTGLGEASLETLRAGLQVVAGSFFELAGDEQTKVAVPLTAQSGDPSKLLEALANEDIAVALELALDDLPSSHWALEALLGRAAKPALDRLPVGPKVLNLLSNTRTDADLDSSSA